jgi:hypothetical protein
MGLAPWQLGLDALGKAKADDAADLLERIGLLGGAVIAEALGKVARI